MSRAAWMLRAAAWTSAAAWAALIAARGRFWDARADCLRPPLRREGPDVVAVVPARNEADVLWTTLTALLAQDYPGTLRVVLVDDASDDGTAGVARAAILARRAGGRARTIAARARPSGWTGKLWALSEGVRAAREEGMPRYWWFTDADVEHPPDTLARLVATALAQRRALVSQMVALHCSGAWERLLIPAFVFFFKLVYPFSWVNDDRRATAGAAGGCVLLEASMLEKIGGIASIRGELIDDCALAAAVKRAGGGLWLELSTRSRSLRPYGALTPIWSMVARTAYAQLRRSPLLLAATVAGMLVLYAVPVAAVAAGRARRDARLTLPGAVAWALLSAAYVPILRRYRISPLLAPALPLAALLYTAMTVDSARRSYAGREGMWKGRTSGPQFRSG